MSKEQERPGIRQQSWGSKKPVGNNEQIKSSVLADVNKQIIHNESGKSGGA